MNAQSDKADGGRPLRILLVNGPNLNLLGEREPEVYGTTTLAEIEETVRQRVAARGAEVDCFQSNSEGGLIDYLHGERKRAHGVVINPGAYTHYSYALRDALVGIQLPFVEIHISDPQTRESFRRVSVLRDVALATVAGRGAPGYLDAVDLLIDHLRGAG